MPVIEPQFIRFGNHAIGDRADLDVWVPAENSGEFSANQTYRDRPERGPVLETRSYSARELPFEADQGELLNDNDVFRILAVRTGEQELEFYEATTGAFYTGLAAVNSLRRQPPALGRWEGTFTYREPFKALTATTTTGSELDVYGNVFALPTLTITPTTTTAPWRPLTATDNTGRGLANHPVRFDFNSTGQGATDPENYRVFYGPRPVDFYVLNPDTADTAIWVRVDIPPDGDANLTVFYGSSVNNTITANAYLSGGMDLENSTNTSWTWNEWNVREYPDANGVWQPGIYRPSHDHAGVQLSSDDYVHLRSRSETVVDDLIDGRDANALVLMTGVPAADSDDNLTGLYRKYRHIPASGAHDDVRFDLAYQKPGERKWTTAWSDTWEDPSSSNIDDEYFHNVEPVSVPAATNLALAIIRSEDTNAEMQVSGGALTNEESGTLASDGSFGTNAWSNPSNALTADTSYASATEGGADGNSEYLKLTNLGLNVPTGATVTGAMVEVWGQSADDANETIERVRMVRADGTIGATDGTSSKSLFYNRVVLEKVERRFYGGPDDEWGETLTPAFVNDVDFGFVLAMRGLDFGGNEVRVHLIRVYVFYSAQATLALDTLQTPTATVGTVNTGRVLDGTVTVTHPDSSTTTITFDDVYLSDTNLTINCDDMRMTVAADTWFTGGRGITPSDTFRWLALQPGKHTISHDLDATIEASWHERLEL